MIHKKHPSRGGGTRWVLIGETGREEELPVSRYSGHWEEETALKYRNSIDVAFIATLTT